MQTALLYIPNKGLALLSPSPDYTPIINYSYY